MLRYYGITVLNFGLNFFGRDAHYRNIATSQHRYDAPSGSMRPPSYLRNESAPIIVGYVRVSVRRDYART